MDHASPTSSTASQPEYVFTQNRNYATDGTTLYMRKGHVVPRNHTESGEAIVLNKVTYVGLKSKTKYFKDCVITAEDLISETYPNDVQSTEEIRSVSKVNGLQFGRHNKANIHIAEKLRKNNPDVVNENANPGVGEAYVIVSSYVYPEYPYHAAAVIAEDGNSRVTLEVFAGGKDAEHRDQRGSYEIYTVNSTKGSFHDTWSENPYFRSGLGTKPPTTFVITKK